MQCSLPLARNPEHMSAGCHTVSALAMIIICNNNVISKDNMKAGELKEST